MDSKISVCSIPMDAERGNGTAVPPLGALLTVPQLRISEGAPYAYFPKSSFREGMITYFPAVVLPAREDVPAAEAAVVFAPVSPFPVVAV